MTDCSSCLVPPPACLARFTVYSRSLHAMDIGTNSMFFWSMCTSSGLATAASSALDGDLGMATATSLDAAAISASVPARLDPMFI